MYHFREFELAKLKLFNQNIDIFTSHEWPTCATSRLPRHARNLQSLLKVKPYFKNEVNSGQLGSKNLTDLLDCLKPRYWFSAHLHCHFNSLIPSQDKHVEFQALDKPIPRRRYMDVYEISPVSQLDDPKEHQRLQSLMMTQKKHQVKQWVPKQSYQAFASTKNYD
jgi:lariat debranching enzyme